MKKNRLILGILLLLVALGIGYAAFSTDLIISGTAEGTGTWDVKFSTVTMSDETHGTAVVTNDTTITVDADLAFPGDAVTITANILNGGNIPAKLTAFAVTLADGTTPFTDADVEVLVPTLATDGSEVIAAGATCPVTFVVKWKATSVATTVDSNFKINFTYEQSPAEVIASAAHGTHTGTP